MEMTTLSPPHNGTPGLGNISFYEASREEHSSLMGYIRYLNSGPEMAHQTTCSAPFGFLGDMDTWTEGYRKELENLPSELLRIVIQSAQLLRSPTETRHHCAGSYSNGKQTPLSCRSQGVEMSH